MSLPSSSLNELLRQQLLVAKEQDEKAASINVSGPMIEVPGTGKIISNAYEQLRNATEYSEEHLLLQRAIKRFCRRNLLMTKRPSHSLGAELIVELTQAGYLQSGKISRTTADNIDKLVDQYMMALTHLRQLRVPRERATGWILAILATETENMLNPHNSHQASTYFAYQYFLETISKNNFENLRISDSYEFCMYIAVHQALLKSDIDIVRHDLMTLNNQTPDDIVGFKQLNQEIDHHFNSPLTQKLKRVISRHGAPFRILNSLVDSKPDLAETLKTKQLFMNAYNWEITRQYQEVNERLNKGLIKSILFIFITKTIIGIAIEIPYDLITTGSVDYLPLAVNLLFPVVYMASLKLGIRPPSTANSHTVRNYMENLLFGDAETQIQLPAARKSSAAAKFIYGIIFLIPLAITILVLQKIGFNVVQMIIFFIFFSTASFLGFRLSSMVRELELTTRQTGLVESLIDFFYLPFIMVGQWLSGKYGKINLLARFLDVAIELPLKSVLRLIRQWIRFLNEKHDELY